MLITRIVTSEHCPKCTFYIKALNKQQYKFEAYDADNKANQKQLDEWRIANMPVVQIVELKNDGDPIVWYQFGPGQVSPRAIELKKTMVMKQREKKIEQQETLRQLALQKEKSDAEAKAKAEAEKKEKQ